VSFFQRDVPDDQQPVVELDTLRRQPFFSWSTTDAYSIQLVGLYGFIMLFFSLPISSITYPVLPAELKELLAAAHTGTVGVLVLFVLRLRYGWGAAGVRLRQRATYYEAEGRGQSSRKDRETALRDRLLDERDVQPNLVRIDKSLQALLLSITLSIFVLDTSDVATLKTLYGDDSIRYTNKLRYDDEFAAAEQAKALGKAYVNDEQKPLYCGSRYYKILAGGNGQGGVGCD